MIEQLIGILITFAVCWLVIWLVDHIGVPVPFNWIIKVIFVLILIVWVLQKYGIANI